MSFPHYERYKDSGMEWLGEVPEHWQVNRLKQIADVFPSNVDKKEYADEVPVRLCNYTDVYYNDVITADMELMKATASQEQVDKFTLRSGDTILTKDSETADDIAISAYVPNDLPGVVCGYHLSIARPKPDAVGAFIKRVFDAAYIRAQAEVAANGLTRVGLSQYALDNLLVAYPNRNEQSQIAQFLDRETLKIDALIEEQQRLIEFLKEKRQAAIFHAVTKGLNSNTQMVDSEIGWIGLIPSHWRIVRLRLLADVRGGVAKGRNFGEAETVQVPYLRVANVQAGYLDLGDVTEIEIEPHELERYRLLPGDVLMNEGGDFDKLGRGAIWRGQIEDCIHQNHVFSVRLHDVEPEWVTLVSSSDCGRFYFMTRSKQSTNLASISSSNLRELPVPLPPKNERRAIIEKVTAHNKAVDALIEDTARAIELMQERRNALISAAVTGKIDVRASMEKPIMSATQYSSGFAHQLLAAEILDRCNSQRMGRIKLQKLIHLCEYHGQVSEVQGDYSRKAAGPFDAKAMAGISKNLKKQKWFEEVKEGERYVYRPLEKRGEHKKYLAHWQAEMPRIDEVLSLLGNFRTRECEIVSTLYAAWNDLLIDGGLADDATILHEASSAERWHKSKEQIAPERWKKALQWMKDKGLVPVGYGKHTRHTAVQIGTAPEVAHEPA